MIHSIPVFIGVTLGFMGGCAFMTGHSISNTWRPLWQVLAYALLLGAADRFLVFALFGGPLLSLAGYGLDTLVLAAIGAAAWRATRARRMCLQYPWLYERVGLFGWRERLHHHL
ncbi:DUF6867 family protein [Magnetospirillum gryphiswaldense]|uniref:DUF6867 domain-containing protein n=1 Tax=Magnetospirillum gryphiswaldense TaxID=55518 RepID=A4TXQ1_9PROT|nr:hypothetical protein [Magnetospirillum gryphiswaldense]AVM73807.1 hypothetical protein MSR1_13150 [Magnetospirillum gryphiswaldense MSR-1]AVM77710.1 hypothetical protein MSR1L_13150 [Magnetospirillum gryphiswaldense]CAM75408.1 conserved hypothetical protein [Magnetospirillum gryphiswaldense MSR-1]